MIIVCLVAFTTLGLAVTFANRAKTPLTNPFHSKLRRGLFVATAVAAMVTIGLYVSQRVFASQPPNDYGSVPVGTLTAPVHLIAVRGTSGTTIDTVAVFSSGIAATGSNVVDYSDVGGPPTTCIPGFVFSAANSNQCTVNVQFAPKGLGQRNGAVAVSGGGVVAGITYLTGIGTGLQSTYTPGTITNPASFGAYIAANGGALSSGALDGAGNAYIVANQQVLSVVPAGNTAAAVTAVAGAAGSAGFVDSTVANSRFSDPSGLAVNAAGAVFVADTGNNAVRAVLLGFVQTVAGNLPGGAVNVTPANQQALKGPTAVAVDAQGNLYIADSGNFVIRKVDPSAGTISVFAGSGVSGFAGDGLSATDPAVKIGAVSALAFDSLGDLLFSDTTNNVIRQVSTTGKISTIAGTGKSGATGDGGIPIEATLNNPGGIAVDAGGDIYIADTGNAVVRRIDVTSNLIDTVAGIIGVSGTTVSGSGSTLTNLNQPVAVAFDSTGKLHIFDAKTGDVDQVDGQTVPTISLGSVAQNRASAPQNITVENSGTDPFTITSVAVAPGFTVDPASTCEPQGGAVFPLTLIHGQTCFFKVTATPTATQTAGALFTGNLVVTSQVGIQTIALSATATGEPTKLVFVTAPLTTVASPGAASVVGSPITVQEQDSNGASSGASGDTVTLTVTGPSPTVTYTAVVNANGIASFDLSGVQLITTGTYTYVASVKTTGTQAAITPVTVTEQVTAGAATKVVATLPTTGQAGVALSALTATVEDLNNNIVTTSIDNILVTVTGPGGYSSSVNANAVAGVATVPLNNLTPFTTPGAYTVTLSDTTTPGLTLPPIATLTITGGAPISLGTPAPPLPATQVAGTNTLTSVQIKVLDSNQNVVTGSTDNLQATVTGPGAYSQTLASTAVAGVATFALNTLPVFNTAGTYTVTFSDLTNATVTSSTGSFTVGVSAAAKTIASLVPATLVAGGNVGNVTITVQDSAGNTVTSFNGPANVAVTGPGPNGTVLNFSGTLTNGTGTIAANTPLNAAGTYTVIASADGFNATAQTVTVSAGAATKIGVTVPNVPAGGTLGTLTATVQDANGNTVTTSSAVFTGTVTGPNGYSQPVPPTTAVNGVASINLSGLPVFNVAGTYTITLNATGGLTVTKTFTVTVGAASKLTVAPITTPITAGGNIGSVVVTVVDAFGNTVTASTAPVTVTITGPGGFTFTSAPVPAANGIATISLSGTPLNTAGTYSVTVASPNLTSPPAISITVNAQTSAAFVIVSGFPTAINAGASAPVTVTVQDAQHNTSTSFTGTVTLTSSDTKAVFVPTSFTYTVADAGVHSFTATLNTAGTQSITATTGGVSGSETGIVVGKVTTTSTLTLTPGGAGSAFGVPQTLTATIVPASAGANVAGGTVQFTDNGTALGAPVALAGGKATLSLPAPAPGAHLYTGVYSGDVNFGGSTSNAVPFLVTQSATTTTVTSSGSPSVQGAAVTFTATVVGAGGGTPTGTVSFFDGTTLLGSGTLAGGKATLTTTFTSGAAHSITAVYGGDLSFTGSTSAAFLQVVTAAFTITVNPSSLNLKSGDKGFVAVTLTGNGGFSGTVNLTCTNLPATMQCTFFPATVGVGSSTTTVELIVRTRGIFNTGTVSGNDAPAFPALAFWLPGAALSAFGLRRKGMNGRKRQALLLVVLMLGMGGLLGLSGCGSGTGPKTPAGTYVINVVGTSGTVVDSAPLTVVIR